MTDPLKIHSGSNALLYTTPVNIGCRRRVQLMNEDSITVKFSDKAKMKFPVGTRIGDFYITKEQQEKYNATTGGYDYELKFDAYYWLWANRLLFYVMPGVTNAPKETSFKLTATIDIHAAVILRALNALGFTYDGSPFRVDTDEGFSTEAKYISYANMSILGGIQAIADAYECEWWVVGNSIHFGKCNAIGEYDFTVGENVESITSDAKTTPANRLVVFGSTRNLPPNYRTPESSDVVDAVVVKRLMLPEETPYLQTSPDIPEDEIVEEEVVLDSVYPRTSLSVTDVETYDSTTEGVTQTFYRVKYGTSFLFSKDYILPDEELHVVFESGNLNGMDFAVKFNPLGIGEKTDDDSFNPEAQMFEIVINEDYGRALPDAVLHPEIGDKFSLYGWDSTKMEALGLLAAAEQELLTEGNKLLDEYRKDKQTYTCPMMWDWCKEQSEEGNTPRLGSVVNLHFVSGDTGRKSRIIGFEHDLDIEYSNVTYICGEKVSVSRLKTLESKVEGLTHTGEKAKVQNSLDFLSKRYSDRTPYQLASDMGFDVGDFLAGTSGGRFGKDAVTGQTFLEVDRVFARVRAYFESLTVVERESLAGEQMVTPGGGVKCVKVEEVFTSDKPASLTGWRCYFLSEQDGEKRETKIKAGDQAIAQTWNATEGTANKVSNRRWWRLVTGVENDAYTDDCGNHYGYVEVSASDCEDGSDIPQEGDEIIQFGNRTDRTRQAAIVTSTVSSDAPSIKLFSGIDSYDLNGRDIISQGYDSARGHAYMRCYGDTYIGAPDGSTYVKYDIDEGKTKVKADIEITSTIGGKSIDQYFGEKATEATDKYKYLAESLGKAAQDSTYIKGGLMLSTMIALGYSEGEARHILSGMNGSYNADLGGRTIAAWYGGEMLDLFDRSGNRIANPTGREAASLFRMDGSFYFANGNIGGRTDGSGWLAGENITWDASGAITFGNGIKINLGDGSNTTLGGISDTLSSVVGLVNTIGNHLVPTYLDGGVYKETTWAAITNGTHTLAAIKTKGGFFSDKFISAKGASDTSGGAGATQLRMLTDVGIDDDTLSAGQALVYNGTKWVNQTVAPGLDETSLAAYLTDNNYAKKSDIPSLTGYATETWVEGKGYLTEHQDISGKVDKVAGKGLSTNDFTTALLDKLNGIAAGANKYVHPTHTARKIAAASGLVLSSITVNAEGHVTEVGSKTLTASDIPALAISKITGLRTELDGKATKDELKDVKDYLDSLFTLETDAASPGGKRIRANFGLYSGDYISAKGVDPDSGVAGGGAFYGRLDTWEAYDANAGDVLSATLGVELRDRLDRLPDTVAWGKVTGKPTTIAGYGITDAKISGGVITIGTASIRPLTEHQPLTDYLKKTDAASTYLRKTDASATYLTKTDASATYQPKGNYLTAHQEIHALTLKAGAFTAVTYNPKTGAATVNIPTTTSHISEGTNKYFTDARAVAALKTTTDALNTAIVKKLDASVFEAFKKEFDSMFVKETDANSPEGYRIKAKFGLYSPYYLSAKGANPDGGGGGSAFGLYTDWAQTPSPTDALGAVLGKSLYMKQNEHTTAISGLTSRVTALEGKNYLDALTLVQSGAGNAVTAVSLSADKKTLTVTKGSTFLTTSSASSTYLSKTDAGSTYLTKTDAASTYVAKEAGKGLSEKNFTTALLNKLNGIAEGANRYVLPVAKAAVLGGVMIGTSLSVTAAGLLDLPDKVAAETYTKVTVDAKGRVTAGATLAAADIPTLSISKVSGLQDALDSKAAKSDFNTLKTWIESMFEKVTLTGGATAIRAKFGLYSNDFISAKGASDSSGGGGGGYSRLDAWADYASDKAGYVLSASLGYGLHTRLLKVYTKDTIDGKLAGIYTKTEADGRFQPKGNYLTAHQTIHALTIQKNGSTVGTYTPNSGAKTINIADVASASTLSSHTGNTTAHITAAERTRWNKVVTDFAAITGTDSDTIINKWEEVVAFLDTYTEADTLAGLLGNKADKATTLAGYGITDAKIANGVITLGANTITPLVSGNMKKLTFSAGTFSAKDYTPNLSAVTVNVPTTTAHISEATSHLYFTNARAVAALKSTTDALNTAIGKKLDAATFNTFKALFDSMFEKVTTNGVTTIRAKFGLWTNEFLSSKGRSSDSGGGSGFGLYTNWSATPSSTDALGAVLGKGLHDDLSKLATRVTSLEGGSALSVTTTGSGNAITAISKSGTVITATKGATFLTAHQSLANYVTLNTEQTITGAKTFTGLLTIGVAGAGAPSATIEKNLVCLHPVAHTGGPWYINSQDTSTIAYLRILYKATQALRLRSNGELTAASFVKSGGTASQFLKADGSVDSNTYLTTSAASSTYLPKASYTAADILAKLKTVDGSGSGLDADMLDGYHISNYQTGGWNSLATYNQDSSTNYARYSHKLFKIDSSIDCILRFRVTTDTNYPSYGEWVLRVNHATDYGKCVSLSPAGVNRSNIGLTVYVDSDYGVWVQTNAIWGSSFQYRVERGTLPSVITTVSGTPPNVMHTLVNVGCVRNDVTYGAMALQANAESATKLADNTTFKAWGRTFFTNGKPAAVDGAMTINYTGETGILLKRTESGSGAFIRFCNNNQTANYFRMGMYGAGYFDIGYNGNHAFAISVSNKVGINTLTPEYQLDVNGIIKSNNEIRTTAANGFRIARGNYGFIIRNDGNNTYFMMTNSGDANGSYNSLRPLYINDSTGRVTMGNGLSVNEATVNTLKIGSVTITYDSNAGGLKISGGGLYSDSYISAKGASTASGGASGFGLYTKWDNTPLATDALGAVLGKDLYNNKLDKSAGVTALGTSGNYLTWTKNGTVNNITVPYATTAAMLTGTQEHKGTALADFDTTKTRTYQATTDLGDGITYSAILSVSAGSSHRYFQIIGGKGNVNFLRWRTTDANGATLGAVRCLLDESNYSGILDGRYYTETEVNTKLTNGSVTKVGTSTVGGTAKPIYLNAGTPTALSATVGAANRPVYLNAGTITAGSYTFGNASGNAPVSNGTVNTNLNADMLDGIHAVSFEGYYKTTIDASALDNDTWYPVLIAIGNSLQTRIRIEGCTDADATWNSRSDNGMAVVFDWIVNGSQYGWTNVQRTVLSAKFGAGSTGSNCIRGIGQLTRSSNEYVFVRGGAKYDFYISRNIVPVLRTSSATINGQTIAPTTTDPGAIVRNNALITDNVASATKLQTARTINGTSFDGSANITTANWGTARSIGIVNSDGTGTAVVTSVNGSANINLKLPATIKAALTGNATTATALQTTRTLWGQNFNGGENVSGNLATVGNITGSGAMTISSTNGRLTLNGAATALDLKFANTDAKSVILNGTAFKPYNAADNALELGTDDARWKKITACNMRLSSSKAQGGGDVYAELWRGTSASWKIVNTGGYLKFQSNYTTVAGSYFDCMTLDYNTGNAYIKGSVGIGTTAPQHKLDVNGNIRAAGWLRTTGATGWINDTYGGGLYMADTTWVRIYGGKSFYQASGILRTDGTLQVGNGGTYLNASSGGMTLGVNLDLTKGHISFEGSKKISGTPFDLFIETPELIQVNSQDFIVNAYIDCSQIIYAKTGIWSDGYVSGKGQSTTSDARLKQVLRPVYLNVKDIAAAPSVEFVWKEDGFKDVGSIAQYWEKLAPQLVNVEPKRGMKCLQYGKAALMGVIAVARKTESLEIRVERLEKENRELKRKLETIKKR